MSTVRTQAAPAQRGEAISEATRLRLFQLQVEIRYTEKRAYDMFLQNLVKGTSHLSIGMEAIRSSSAVVFRRYHAVNSK